ncbi:hypothetical protein HanRHA438_Chr14g0657371 [Helianthus annuus]|nr:hypothetical protein HanRHA438_Chr14g0657371 [Helianthus annuus]
MVRMRVELELEVLGFLRLIGSLREDGIEEMGLACIGGFEFDGGVKSMVLCFVLVLVVSGFEWG